MQSSRELFESIARGESAACDAESGPRAELEARYRPMLASFARRVGLETGRIDAAVDRALLHLFESLGEESPLSELGSSERLFRTAGMQIADTSLSASDSLQTLSGLEEAWRSEWRRALVRFALQSLSASADTDHRAPVSYTHLTLPTNREV